MKKVIDVYPYCINADGLLRFLLLHRSSHKQYARQWRMVGGKVKEHEAYWQAGYRELTEEVGITPSLFWTVPSLNQFYEPESDQIMHIPAFAAELAAEAEIQLNEEHTGYEWVSLDTAKKRILWPEQLRLMNLISGIILERNILPDWIINTKSSL